MAFFTVVGPKQKKKDTPSTLTLAITNMVLASRYIKLSTYITQLSTSNVVAASFASLNF